MITNITYRNDGTIIENFLDGGGEGKKYNTKKKVWEEGISFGKATTARTEEDMEVVRVILLDLSDHLARLDNVDATRSIELEHVRTAVSEARTWAKNDINANLKGKRLVERGEECEQAEDEKCCEPQECVDEEAIPHTLSTKRVLEIVSNLHNQDANMRFILLAKGDKFHKNVEIRIFTRIETDGAITVLVRGDHKESQHTAQEFLALWGNRSWIQL